WVEHTHLVIGHIFPSSQKQRQVCSLNPAAEYQAFEHFFPSIKASICAYLTIASYFKAQHSRLPYTLHVELILGESRGNSRRNRRLWLPLVGGAAGALVSRAPPDITSGGCRSEDTKQ